MTMSRDGVSVLVPLFALCGALMAGPALAEEPQQLPGATIGAPTASTRPQSLRLAEIVVLSLTDRDVKLRLTLGGVVHPAFQNPGLIALSWPTSGPFATITVTPVVFRRQ